MRLCSPLREGAGRGTTGGGGGGDEPVDKKALSCFSEKKHSPLSLPPLSASSLSLPLSAIICRRCAPRRSPRAATPLRRSPARQRRPPSPPEQSSRRRQSSRPQRSPPMLRTNAAAATSWLPVRAFILYILYAIARISSASIERGMRMIAIGSEDEIKGRTKVVESNVGGDKAGVVGGVVKPLSSFSPSLLCRFLPSISAASSNDPQEKQKPIPKFFKLTRLF